ncbi:MULTISPECIES: signal peptidase II [Bacillaceae]|uniref:Lipoprotein signal peptidase n=1 Tax=Bacillus salipaludis TaxID=2547811 RepID=A0A4R5VZ94_9BACI|nr:MULTISPECIES: signal peptidase II [Bacillaceae]MBI0578421.1 signal peptidase II [Neobacillus cucumis]MDQ6596890.1 signal peptidase II [Bacillus salipaludis]MED1469603.1 signal peptidase II [Bacillus salipaludis]TDK64898.1 lipoprotein signal peptidase [Bacillus salipaludis]WHY93530.1 signal peptidase II [Neobacillus cucumis]
MFYYLIAIFVIVLDQITKWLIVSKMHFGESITIIENFLYITSHRNRGAAWGILQGQMWLFYVITLVVIIALIYYLQKAAKGKWLLGVSLSFMLGGAIGNFIDRVIRKEVVDFIHTFIFGYNFPVFNIADSALVIGVILLMISMLRDERESKEKSYGENGTHHS